MKDTICKNCGHKKEQHDSGGCQIDLQNDSPIIEASCNCKKFEADTELKTAKDLYKEFEETQTGRVEDTNVFLFNKFSKANAIKRAKHHHARMQMALKVHKENKETDWIVYGQYKYWEGKLWEAMEANDLTEEDLKDGA